jgi:hypothetical protein
MATLDGLDRGFPNFTGTESVEQRLKMIQNYLFMLLESLQHMFSNLSENNFNASALEKLKADLKTVVETQLVISTVILTQNLYAEYGDIAELDVDRVCTLNKVALYWAGTTTDINFVRIRNQTAEWVTGSVVKVGGVAQTVQHVNRDGLPLYYRGAVTGSTYKTVGMDTVVTAFPVMVYDYVELTKGQMGHIYNAATEQYGFQLKIGAGTGVGDYDKLIFKKPYEDKADITYIDDTGNQLKLEFAKGGTIKASGNTGDGLSIRNFMVVSSLPTSGLQNNDLIILKGGV